MTKRLVIAAVFLLASLSGSISSYIYIQTVFGELEAIAENVYESDDENYFEEISILNEKWQKNSRAVAVILKHTDADTLERYFHTLEKSASSGDIYFSRKILSELIAFLRVTAEGEKAEIQNIF